MLVLDNHYKQHVHLEITKKETSWQSVKHLYDQNKKDPVVRHVFDKLILIFIR